MISAKDLGRQCDILCAEIDKEIQHEVDLTCVDIETRMLNSIKKDPTKRYIKINSEYQDNRFSLLSNTKVRCAVQKKFEDLGYNWREISDRGISSKVEITIWW